MMSDMPALWANKMVTAISETLVEKETVPPKALIMGMYTHASHDFNMGVRPKTLAEFVTIAFLARLMRKFEIKATGCSIVKELPIRNTNVYQHTFQTKEGKEFYAYQFGFAPISAVEQLASSIMEIHTTTGCIHCEFKGFVEEDVQCPVCRNGATRGMLYNDERFKTFRKYGWNILKETIGETYSNIFFEFGKEYHKFFSDIQFYLDTAGGEIYEWKQDHEYGDFFESDIEHDICLILKKYESQQDDESEEAEEEQGEDFE